MSTLTNFPRIRLHTCEKKRKQQKLLLERCYPSSNFCASADPRTLKLRISENSLSFIFNLPDGSLHHNSSMSATSVGMSYSATVKNSTEWMPINCSMPHCWEEIICSTSK